MRDEASHDSTVLFTTGRGDICEFQLASGFTHSWWKPPDGVAIKLARSGPQAVIVAVAATNQKCKIYRLDATTAELLSVIECPREAGTISGIAASELHQNVTLMAADNAVFEYRLSNQTWVSAKARLALPIEAVHESDNLVAFGPQGIETIRFDDKGNLVQDTFPIADETTIAFQLCANKNSLVALTDKHLLSIELSNKTQHEIMDSPIGACGIALAPDGKRIAISKSSGPCLIVDTESHENPVILEESNELSEMRFSKDSGKLVGLVGRHIAVWDTRTGALLSFPGHLQSIVSMEMTPDGTHLASLSSDGHFRFWDIANSTVESRCSFGAGPQDGLGNPTFRMSNHVVLGASPGADKYWRYVCSDGSLNSRDLPHEFSVGFDVASISPNLETILYANFSTKVARLFMPSHPESSKLIVRDSSASWFRKNSTDRLPSSIAWNRTSTVVYGNCETGGVLSLDLATASLAMLAKSPAEHVLLLASSISSNFLAIATESGEVFVGS